MRVIKKKKRHKQTVFVDWTFSHPHSCVRLCAFLATRNFPL